MEQDDNPFFHLVDLAATAILGMGCIGGFALLASLIERDSLPQPEAWWGFLLIAFAVGCVVGILSLPFVLLALWNKQIRPVVVRIYAPNTVIVVVWQFITDFNDVGYFSCALVAWIGVCGSAVILRPHLPDVPTSPSGLCPKCSYDLRGELSKGCPECGWNRPPA